MQMNQLSKTSITLVMLVFSSALMANQQDLLYQCPSIDSIHKNPTINGEFSATYTKNGITTEWSEVESFYKSDLNSLKFVHALGLNDCVGDTCSIDCVYKIKQNNEYKYMFMSINYQAYRFYSPASKNWKRGECDANKPSDCPFYMVSNTI